MTNRAATGMTASVGARLREARLAARLTVREAAERAVPAQIGALAELLQQALEQSGSRAQ